MATDSRTRIELAILQSFSTDGAPRTSTAARVVQEHRTRNWVRNFPNRRAAMVKLLADGYLPTSYYEDNLTEIVHSKVVDISGRLTSDPKSIYQFSFIPATPRTSVDVLTDSVLASLSANVVEQLQSRISGNGTNLYVSAAEATSTVGMIGDAAAKLAGAYRDVRRGSFSKAAKRLGLPSVPKGVRPGRPVESNWLEYRYGWRLVVTDVDSLMKTLYDSLTKRPPVLRVTARAESVLAYRWAGVTETIPLPNGKNAATYTSTKRCKYSREVRGGYVYELSSVPLATGQSFGLLNPFLVAWEVIPYSFVVDWFVNVGSVLEGLTAFTGKKWLDGWLCKAIESSTTYTWTGLKKTPEVFSMEGPSSSLLGPVVERKFQRSRVSFTPSSLRIGVDMGVSRTLDAISLIAQRAR